MNIPKRMRYALLAATLAATTGGIAVAQSAATYDPAQLPATKGKVAQYSLTPRGDVDGLILDDGTEIHFPPHLGTQLVFLVKPGDSVTVNGLKARNVPMVMALQITNDATSKSVVDSGPPAGGPPPREHGPGPAGPGRPGGPGPMGQTLEAQGVVKAQLHGPRGDLNGVLLQDGTIVRLPPPEAQRREAALAVGKTVFVQGDGLASPLGRVVAARTIGTSAQDATALPMPPPPRDRRGPALAGPGAPPPPPPAPTSN